MANPTYANIAIQPIGGGSYYALNGVITSTEADLNTVSSPPVPITIPANQGISATVELSISGAPGANQTYVIMQTDFGDGIWFDVCGLMWMQTQGSANFLLSAGHVAGSSVTQQTRNPGQPQTPQANFSNNIVLGGRIRFVGQAKLSGGSSYSQGGFAGVNVTIKYRMLPVR